MNDLPFDTRSYFLIFRNPANTVERSRVWEFVHYPDAGIRVRYFPQGKGYPPIDEAWLPADAIPSRAAEERMWRHDWNPTNTTELSVPVWDWELLPLEDARRSWDALMGTGEWIRVDRVPHGDRAWGPVPPEEMRNSNGKVHCPQAFHEALCRVFGTTTQGGKTVPNIPQGADMSFAYALTA